MKPKKSVEDKWVKLRELGEIGERFIEKYLKERNYLIMPLNLYTMSDKSHKKMEWEVLKAYPKIPDFIAKYGNEIFLLDIKTKRKYDHSKHNFIVNVRDYKHYLKFSEILPVKIYFLFVNHKNQVLSLFLHVVEKRDYPVLEAWDKNKVYDLSEYKEQIE